MMRLRPPVRGGVRASSLLLHHDDAEREFAYCIGRCFVSSPRWLRLSTMRMAMASLL